MSPTNNLHTILGHIINFTRSSNTTNTNTAEQIINLKSFEFQDKQRERERERERKSVCTCVHAHVCNIKRNLEIEQKNNLETEKYREISRSSICVKGDVHNGS